MSEPIEPVRRVRRQLRVVPSSDALPGLNADVRRPTAMPQPVDPAAVQAAFDRLSAIFSDMMVTVAEVSTHRCPYKNRFDRCTAKFGCRNQLRPTEPGGLKVCGGDDKLDYRSAWETS